jgi:hypothetical protein
MLMGNECRLQRWLSLRTNLTFDLHSPIRSKAIQKRFQKLVFLTCGALLLVVALLFARDREPTYGGKTLSQWTVLLAQSRTHDFEAEAAIRHFGLSALTYFTEWLQYKDQPPDGRVNYELSRLWSRVHAMLGGSLPPDQRELRAVGAARAICLLGSEPTHDIVELAALPKTPLIVKNRVISGLCKLGPEGLPYLVYLLRDRQEPFAAVGLAAMGTNAYRAIPVLIPLLSNSNLEVASSAADVLGALHHDPERVVPALISFLDRTNHSTRMAAIAALTRFGRAARSAAPSVQSMLEDPSPSAREMATNFFLSIAR